MRLLKGFSLIALLACSASVQAQQFVPKFYPVAFYGIGSSGDDTTTDGGRYIVVKAGCEAAFANSISTQLNLGAMFDRLEDDYDKGNTPKLRHRFLVEPQFKWYFADDAPWGWYFGVYGLIAIGKHNTIFGATAHIGYQYFFLDDRLALDGSFGLGGNYSNTVTGFHSQFQVGVGWAFFRPTADSQ